MTAEEFLMYKGLKTKGSHGGFNFGGGVVVGYRENSKPTEFQSLVAFFNDDRGLDKADMSEVISFDDNGFFLGDITNGTFLYVSLENLVFETEKEKKELDLAEILDGCKGVELWSDMFGKCTLAHIQPNEERSIAVKVCKSKEAGQYELFTKDGKTRGSYVEGKCMLWPSETNRDWSTFKKPLKADDWVVACDGEGCGHINKYCNINRTWKYVIPFEKYNPNLTKEELKKLSIV